MIQMVADEAQTLDEAYRKTVDGLRNLGWKDLELDSKKRGINASFESEKEVWEILLNFESKGSYEVCSRSSWKVQNETLDIVQHLVDKINNSNPEHYFRMNDNGSFEVKTTASIPDKNEFMESIKKSMVKNIQRYELYAGMLKRFVNIGPEYLENETEGFRLLLKAKSYSINNLDEHFITIDLKK
ncbi:MAG: hypothetical protein OR994_04690 [Candidatus Poseidoniales archaeon]|nr:hypothetical protein [Candidatus Poseidoniales archaeon]